MVTQCSISVVNKVSENVLDHLCSNHCALSCFIDCLATSHSIMWRVIPCPKKCIRLYHIPDEIKCTGNSDFWNVAGSFRCAKFTCLDRALTCKCIITTAIAASTIGNRAFLIPRIQMEICDMNKLVNFSCLNVDWSYSLVEVVDIVVSMKHWRLR